MREEIIPKKFTESIASFIYKAASFDKNRSLGMLRFELDSKVAVIVFLLKDLGTYQRPSFEI